MEDLTKKSILIIDDERSNCTAIVFIFKKDFTVYVAMDPLQGIEVAQKNKPDLILLDIIMPFMDGYQVFQRLKELDETKDIPIVFMSSIENHEADEKLLSLNAVDFINKPFDPGTVKQKITQILV